MPSSTAFQPQLVNSIVDVDDKRKQKTVQNRLNQRARRLRLRAERQLQDSHPYNVSRWRLNSNESEPTNTKSNALHVIQPSTKIPKASMSPHFSGVDPPSAAGLPISPTTLEQHPPNPPLSADNLLHLIQYNVFRGLYINKLTLGQSAVSWTRDSQPASLDELRHSYSVVLPTGPGIPDDLNPTPSQMSILHSIWFNLLPFQAMRENLIRWQFSFNHDEFIADLIGDACTDLLDVLGSQSVCLGIEPEIRGLVISAEDDEVTADRNGLIVWGEPHTVDSWEATPGFLKKWAWTVVGCEELIESSNRWRAVRGEKPLRFSVTYSPAE
ncbi:hypothetical protein N7448_001123 [Penicillium atrosanguineum]|uniref:BZIP domain-containing protein n=1 Tax=Penicillium atrosanguineum TaxID=1132637 RepID=A0A9W9HI08_9EURO|nr:Sugar isomerase (SIS) [Penicillium atrosanguineum]KAJ5133857.1 hypothetical protein N7526_005222 [Penicillium atrosanguineum]KAJ5149545.1 hypothetical protein N7448_001123 [Penicillium atrosanguineum]KAJ5304861.1 Sugar isomerase (SIS) [Penicillium atrosanguineum]KAJ5324325.1 hypothetical protein N7476_002925 [Penicillium atrosanguineum]